VTRLLLPLLAAAALAGVAAIPAAATNECRGLQVCVPVAGPWVSVGPKAVPVQFQLSCPRNFIVGGVDAELSVREIDIAFLGLNGSPVSPGTTTSKDAVFVGTYVGVGDPAPTFRPHIGCVPANGAGGAIPTAYHAFAPGKPTIRRVREVHLVSGARRLLLGCAPNERLVGGWHAVGYFTEAPPTASLVHSVEASRTVGSARVAVAVRAGTAVSRARTIVQVGAVCAPEQ
jgi:hypothetical protein